MGNLAGWSLYTATDITPDGRTNVGIGLNPLGNDEAWIATVPEPSSLLLATLALPALLLKRRRI